MTVDSTLLEARRFHQVIEGTTLVPSLVENRCCRLHDLFPGLLAFGHKAGSVHETGRSFPIIALRFAWMLIATEWSQAEHSSRNLPASCDRTVALASNLASLPEPPGNGEQESTKEKEMKIPQTYRADLIADTIDLGS